MVPILKYKIFYKLSWQVLRNRRRIENERLMIDGLYLTVDEKMDGDAFTEDQILSDFAKTQCRINYFEKTSIL